MTAIYIYLPVHIARIDYSSGPIASVPSRKIPHSRQCLLSYSTYCNILLLFLLQVIGSIGKFDFVSYQEQVFIKIQQLFITWWCLIGLESIKLGILQVVKIVLVFKEKEFPSHSFYDSQSCLKESLYMISCQEP